MIWAHAIRPDQPGAHCFTLSDSDTDNEQSPQTWQAVPTNPHIAFANTSRFSWTRASGSAYPVDSGLWTTCTESRELIQRRFKLTERDIKRTAGGFWRPPDDRPAITPFRASNGERLRCLTHPKTDLFLLRPLGASPPIAGETFGSRLSDPVGNFLVDQIGIDYDPRWSRTTPEPDEQLSQRTMNFAIRAASDQLLRAKTLWFVDYRIRRRPDIVPATEGRHQFYGNGCRFTDVREGDSGWDLDHVGDVFRFVAEQWQLKVDEYFASRNMPADPFPQCRYSPNAMPEVRVLACEAWC